MLAELFQAMHIVAGEPLGGQVINMLGVPVANDAVAEFHEGVSYALPVFSRLLDVTLEGVSLAFSCDHGTIDILS